MGLVIPRPQMRKAERRNVVANLKRHAELMLKYEAEGLPRNDASERAFQELKREKAVALK